MNTKGFTLIELLVAIGIFGIFITIVTGVFTRFMIVERHGIAEGQLITDLRSVMESFTKEVRTGYGSTYSVTSNGKQVVFRNQVGECVGYRVSNDGVFERGATATNGECNAGAINPILFSPLTSSSTNINSISFNTVIALANGQSLANQGVITISISAKSNQSDIQPILLENTITSRQMNPYVQQ